MLHIKNSLKKKNEKKNLVMGLVVTLLTFDSRKIPESCTCKPRGNVVAFPS